jgi:hypothetical protein
MTFVFIGPGDYDNFIIPNQTSRVLLADHLGGFDYSLRSPILDKLQSQTNGKNIIVETEYIVNQEIKNNYKLFDFKFSLQKHNLVLDHFREYNTHPELNFKNFLCSFNGSPHISRKLLVSILNKLGIFDTRYSSKHFVISKDELYGHIKDFTLENNKELFYSKFFLSKNDNFYNKIYSVGSYERFNHSTNIHAVEHSLTSSFVHLVSDTLATSYYPFYGEKFLYSVVTRGLFVTYGQPYWHDCLERFYGFKKYKKIFNYNFDEISNPVDRLIELVTMLLKFNNLSSDDWRDLYQIEQDTIEYNYSHYFSGDYLKLLSQW